jgi:hypothetical protein
MNKQFSRQVEVTITETVEHLRRKRHADLGIALISI